MFGDIGWAELMLIGIVALIVIGPEDLPHMFRQLGRFTAKMRSMSRDFSRAMEQAAKESGVKDVTDGIKGATSATSMGLNTVKAAADRFEKWDPIKSATAAKSVVQTAVPMTPAPVVSPVGPLQAAEPSIHGPETQALVKQQTAKKATLAKAAEKVTKGRGEAESTTKPAPRRKPKPIVAASEPSVALPVVKSRTPRKSKEADEA